MRASLRRQPLAAPAAVTALQPGPDAATVVDAPVSSSRAQHPPSTPRTPARLTATLGRALSSPGDPSWGLRTAALPWITARLIVAGALVASREFVNAAKPSAAVATRVHEGLLGWDAGWYETIARVGYAGAGHLSLRFFPLVPVLTRALGSVPGIGYGAALVVVANVSSLVAVALLAVLARRETGDEALARRAAWLVCLAPAAFTQVMGYAEGTLLALSIGALVALRARAWWWAGVLGLLAGATRPVGLLLVVPAVVEAGLARRAGTRGRLVARAAAVLGPVVGFTAFLGWVGWRYGDALAPLKVQQQGNLRGGVTDPFVTFGRDASYLVHGRHIGSALHLPWAVVALVLLVVTLRRWPVAFGALAAAVLIVALTAANLDGFERYALSAFPLVLAGATVTSGPRVERAVLALAAAGLAVYAVLAFTNLYVP